METTTPFLNGNNDYDDDEDYPANKLAFVGCWITFLILTCLINVVVIVLIVRTYVQRPATRQGLPKLMVMLVSCALLILDAAVPAAMALHTHRVDVAELESLFTCEGIIALLLMFYMGASISSLLVGAVVVVEGLRLQSFVSLTPRIHMTVAVVMVAASVLYGFVVIIPVFYFVYLSDETKPCHEGSIFLDTDYPDSKIFQVAVFLVPHCVVLWACLLLSVAYFTRPNGTRPGVATQVSSAALSSHPVSRVEGDPHSPTNTHTTQGRHPSSPATDTPAGTQQRPGTASPKPDVQFPWYVLLAAAASFVFGLVFFVQAYADLRLQYGDHIRTWYAGLLLDSLRGVFLPCCWLLDREVRAAWSGCRRPVRGPAATGRGPQGGGQETTGL